MTTRRGNETPVRELELAGVPPLWSEALTKYMTLEAYQTRPVRPRGQLLELDGFLEPCWRTLPPRDNPKLHRRRLFESSEAIFGLFAVFNVEMPEYEIRIERNSRGELEGRIRLLIYSDFQGEEP